MTRRVAKVDTNQREIVSYFRAYGAKVHHTHQLGGGFPDICVFFRGIISLIEIKDDKGTLTPQEKEFFDQAKGYPVYVVRNIEDVEAALTSMTKGEWKWNRMT